ncbi:unnamed protein product, partial [Laminaria digitata]
SLRKWRDRHTPASNGSRQLRRTTAAAAAAAAATATEAIPTNETHVDGSTPGSAATAVAQAAAAAAAAAAAVDAAAAAAAVAEREAAEDASREGSTYTLVVKQSKALAPGRRFEIACGSDIVVGRSQHLAGIVVKDEMVSKSHLRIVNSAESGFRVSDLGSKHGAVITKPAPTTTTASANAAARRVPLTGTGSAAPAA